MSQENVEVVRRAMLAAQRHDVEGLQELASDNIRFESLFAGSEGRVFSGPTAARDYFDAVGEAFERVEIELEEVVAARENRVVIRARVAGRGRGSGIVMDQTYAQVWTVSGGKVEQIVSRSDLDEALEAAGLSE